MKKIPEFKSVDEELDFWSKHSILEFMDVGEEVQLDFSEARKEREARVKRGEVLRVGVQICARTRRSARQGSLERNVYGSVAPRFVARIETTEENRRWTWTSRSFATTPNPATR